MPGSVEMTVDVIFMLTSSSIVLSYPNSRSQEDEKGPCTDEPFNPHAFRYPDTSNRYVWLRFYEIHTKIFTPRKRPTC